MPLGRVVALVGGLAVLAAYAMPWFGIQVGNQGIVLSGVFLGRFLSTATDLRQFMPGASGGPNEVLMLRGLVMLFPTVGALAALAACAGVLPRVRATSNMALACLGLVPLVALIVGLSQLPPGAAPELGLWVIGGGSVAVLLGAALDAFVLR
jgi:choline-glycine betaine transporter